MVIILIGAPGAGKGTQGQFLSNELGLPHLSIGDQFRKMAQANDSDGKLLSQYMQDGKLAPSELVNKITAKVLAQSQYNNGCILDGYPRNIEQAEFLENNIKQRIQVIFLQIDNNVAKERILNRFSCANCNAIYSYLDNEEDVCAICGNSNFINRKDDNAKVIENRMLAYMNDTLPIIQYYQNKGNIITVDANRNICSVGQELLELLKKV